MNPVYSESESCDDSLPMTEAAEKASFLARNKKLLVAGAAAVACVGAFSGTAAEQPRAFGGGYCPVCVNAPSRGWSWWFGWGECECYAGWEGACCSETNEDILLAARVGEDSYAWDVLDRLASLGQYLSDEYDPTYYTDMAQLALRGYQNMFLHCSEDGGQTCDKPGKATTSYISHAAISEQVAYIPEAFENGDIDRGNELGLLRLNEAFYPEQVVDSNQGIGLGHSRDDHKLVRPLLDELYGDGDDNVMSYEVDGRWSLDELRDEAAQFIAGRGDSIELRGDLKLWTTKALHRLGLNWHMSDEEAQAFVDYQSSALVITVLPDWVPDYFGWAIGLPDLIEKKNAYIAEYETRIRARIQEGSITTVDINNADQVTKAAWAVLDANTFAGGVSVPSLTHATIGHYLTSLTDDVEFGVHDTSNDLPLLVMESLRMNPAVLGFPYLDNTGYRHAPIVGMAGYDTEVYGSDADNFGFKGDLSFYHQHSMDWADKAVAVDGKPWSARVCPAKDLSYNMVIAFLDAMNMDQWQIVGDDVTEDALRGNGPTFWGDFEIQRK